jgi:hypothetical protein
MIYKGVWKGKQIAVKKFITYENPKLQTGVMAAFEYEKKMMRSLVAFVSVSVSLFSLSS